MADKKKKKQNIPDQLQTWKPPYFKWLLVLIGCGYVGLLLGCNYRKGDTVYELFPRIGDGLGALDGGHHQKNQTRNQQPHRGKPAGIDGSMAEQELPHRAGKAPADAGNESIDCTPQGFMHGKSFFLLQMMKRSWREAPSAPPLGELLSEREAEGVRYEIWAYYEIRTTPPQSARSGCQLPQRWSRGRFAPGTCAFDRALKNAMVWRAKTLPGGLGHYRMGTKFVAALSGGTAAKKRKKCVDLRIVFGYNITE